MCPGSAARQPADLFDQLLERHGDPERVGQHHAVLHERSTRLTARRGSPG